MAKVLDVAQYILSKTGPISTFKLQKLTYYSQAWHCVWEEEPLFAERIEAWANGPVCPALYDNHRGRFTIDAFIYGSVERLTDDERGSIDAVVDYYGKYNGQQLSDLTHAEAPWKNARGDLPPGALSNQEITLEAMVDYYGSLPPAT